MQSLIGYDRVIQLDLKNSIGSIIQILRRLPLSTLDTLLFNDAISGQADIRCYDVLELSLSKMAVIGFQSCGTTSPLWSSFGLSAVFSSTYQKQLKLGLCLGIDDGRSSYLT